MVQPRPLPTLSETHCARLAIPFPCFQRTFSICSRRGPGRKTRHFPPTVADDQLLCNFSQVRNLLHGEWRAETVSAYPMERLLDVLRQHLGLTGPKEGCGEGECGSCSISIDGVLVNSCLVPLLQAKDAQILTIEGLAGDHLHKLQQAFLDCGAAQ